MTPSIGRIVIVRGLDPTTNNGATEAPAVITRAWSTSGPGLWTINVKVLKDAPEDAWLTSIYLVVADEGQAELERRATNPNPLHAVWPPRV